MWFFTRSSSWLNRVFPSRAEDQRPQFPSVVIPSIQPVIDYYGWQRFEEIRVASNSSGANLTDLDWLVDGVSVVPDATLRLVTHLSGDHSDAVTTHALQLSVEHARVANLRVAVSLPFTTIGAQQVCIQRPLVLWPGSLAHLSSTDAVGAGNILTLRGLFIDLPLGEVLHA